MTLKGKGYFIWQIPNCEGGDPNAIAALAKQANLSHVLIKVADTQFSYNIYNGVDVVPPLVQALRARKIEVWGWHYVKGDDPLPEADKAIERVQTLNLDGYVIDAEAQYKEPGKFEAARKFMNRLRAGLPDTPVALSSYRYPSYHPQIPWREFLEKCDYNMPQVYWKHANNAGDQLIRSVREFQAMTPNRPIIPTGAAFREHGWQPSPAEVHEFLQTAQSLNLTAANLYSWDSTRQHVPEVWNTVRDYPWSAPSAPIDITGQYVSALNSRDPDLLLGLYSPSAVHVTASRTIQGHQALRTWYRGLFDRILPNGKFTLTGFSGSGNSRHFNWTATSNRGSVQNGNDTFGLSDGKITYHFSFFSIS